MSSSDADIEHAVAILESLNPGEYCEGAITALVVYEYAITFQEEVRLFWRRKLTGATALFYFNRYLLLLLYIIQWLPSPPQTCALKVKLTFALDSIQYIPWALFAGLRATALSRRRILGIVIFLLSSLPCGANLVRFRYGLAGMYDPLVGCRLPLFRSSLVVVFTRENRLLYVSRIPLMAVDATMVGITWYCVHGSGRLRSAARGSLAYVLIRDGTISFLVLFMMNFLHVVLTELTITTEVQNLSVFGFFVNPISAIIISRFLLDLQSAGQRNAPPVMRHARTPSGTPLLDKERVLGSIASMSTSEGSMTIGTIGHEGEMFDMQPQPRKIDGGS